MQLDIESLDFDACHEEPIHRPEAIQPFGFLIAADPDNGRIRIHSANIDQLLETGGAEDLIGTNIFDLVDGEVTSRQFMQDSYDKARSADIRLPLILRLSQRRAANARIDYHAVVYASQGMMVVEIEPVPDFTEVLTARQQQQLYAKTTGREFTRLDSVEQVAQQACRVVKTLSLFERVVVLKFNEDGTGTVIAEEVDDGLDSYANLTYPATDIPKQARSLYLNNWSRLNPDVTAGTVPLVPSLEDSDREPLDMTHSIVRALSPIHRQYVLNQGLRATMSISLVSEGRLWGLISCHHREPHYLSQEVRLQCESLGHLFGWQLYAKAEELQVARRERTDRAVDRLIDALDGSSDLVDIFRSDDGEVLSLMRSQSFVYVQGEDWVSIGETPPRPLVERLMQRCIERNTREWLCIEDLRAELGDDVPLGNVRGALVVPMMAEERYFTMWLRCETRRTVRWAGLPNEASPKADKRERLSPRASFEVHTQVIDGKSAPWRSHERDIAMRFNRLFLRHALQKKIEVQSSMHRLELRDQVKNEFIATLAHELRNPLSPVKHAVTILEHGRSHDQTAALAVVKRQVFHLSRLVEDLLDVSRVTRRKVRLEVGRHPIQAIVSGSIEQVQVLLDHKQQTLHVQMPDKPLYVDGDSTRLTQVVTNLLGNANKYTPARGHLELRVALQDDWVTIEVEDDGIGIPTDQLQAVFEMFKQVKARSRGSGGGLGIGLTLTRQLVELHGGTVEAHSDGEGKGSRFVVRLPRVNAEPDGAQRADSGVLRVVVVDDNRDAADMLSVLVDVWGHSPTVAYSGEAALDLFEAERFDVALLDLGMPGIDGLELCRRIRAMPHGQDITCIAQTGWGQEEDRRRTREAGFDAHLVKPIDDGKLHKLLNDVVEARRKG